MKYERGEFEKSLKNRISINGDYMKNWETLDAVEQCPGKVSGAWVFRGTRVPVSALFENLRDGASIEQFLEWFPGVKRSQVESVLDFKATTLADIRL